MIATLQKSATKRTEVEIKADIALITNKLAKMREDVEFERRSDVRNRIMGDIEGANCCRLSL